MYTKKRKKEVFYIPEETLKKKKKKGRKEGNFFCQCLGKGNTFSFYFVLLLVLDLSGS